MSSSNGTKPTKSRRGKEPDTTQYAVPRLCDAMGLGYHTDRRLAPDLRRRPRYLHSGPYHKRPRQIQGVQHQKRTQHCGKSRNPHRQTNGPAAHGTFLKLIKGDAVLRHHLINSRLAISPICLVDSKWIAVISSRGGPLLLHCAF